MYGYLLLLKSSVGQVNSHRLQVPAFVGWVWEPVVAGWTWCRMDVG